MSIHHYYLRQLHTNGDASAYLYKYTKLDREYLFVGLAVQVHERCDWEAHHTALVDCAGNQMLAVGSHEVLKQITTVAMGTGDGEIKCEVCLPVITARFMKVIFQQTMTTHPHSDKIVG